MKRSRVVFTVWIDGGYTRLLLVDLHRLIGATLALLVLPRRAAYGLVKQEYIPTMSRSVIRRQLNGPEGLNSPP